MLVSPAHSARETCDESKPYSSFTSHPTGCISRSRAGTQIRPTLRVSLLVPQEFPLQRTTNIDDATRAPLAFPAARTLRWVRETDASFLFGFANCTCRASTRVESARKLRVAETLGGRSCLYFFFISTPPPPLTPPKHVTSGFGWRGRRLGRDRKLKIHCCSHFLRSLLFAWHLTQAKPSVKASWESVALVTLPSTPRLLQQWRWNCL